MAYNRLLRNQPSAPSDITKRRVLAIIFVMSFFQVLGFHKAGHTAIRLNSQAEKQTESTPVPETPVSETPVPETIEQDFDTVEAQLRDLQQLPLFLPRSRGRLITTNQQLSPVTASDPSLYRIQDILTRRYNAEGLIEQWQVYRLPNGLGYMDIVVDESLWQQLNYFRRYAFVAQLGRDAQRDRYHLRVFHSGDAKNRREMLASGGTGSPRRSIRSVFLRGTHLCDFTQPNADYTRCRVSVRQ